MRTEKYHNDEKHDKKEKLTKRSSGTKENLFKYCGILFLVVSVVCAGTLIYMNLLPGKFLYAAIGIILVLLALILPPLAGKRMYKLPKKAALVIAIVLMVIYGIGMIYMVKTIDFIHNITNTAGVQKEEFDVVVKADSPYESADDIQGKLVYVYESDDQTYEKAQERLKEEQQVEYKTEKSLSAMADGVLDGTYEILLVSEGSYSTVCESNDEFSDGTKIIYRMEIEREAKNIAKNVDVKTKPFNVCISGLDVEGSIDIISRSDVNMIMTVNPQSHKILLTSVPRDAYVRLPSKGAMDKLTHSGIYGIEETVETMENLFDTEINYYTKVNYTTVTNLVDAIGGINVTSEYSFTTHGQGVSYDFYEGDNYLDGSRALAFARERKAFASGDFQRNKNQQLVLAGILDKTLSSSTILTKYTSILGAVKENVDMNFSSSDIQKLVKMQLADMPSWDIEQQSVTGVPDSAGCYSMPGYTLSIVNLDSSSLTKCAARIKEVMEGEK